MIRRETLKTGATRIDWAVQREMTRAARNVYPSAAGR